MSKFTQSMMKKGDGDMMRSKLNKEMHMEILRNIQSTQIGKPTQVEAQRILKILDNLYTNLNIMMYLDHDFVVKFQDMKAQQKLQKDLVNALGQQTKELLIRQAEIEVKFKPLIQYLENNEKKQEGEEIEEDKEKEKEKKNQIERTLNELRDNFKSLVRHLRQTPRDFELIKQLKSNQVSAELVDFVHCIKCQQVIYMKKLSTAHEEEEGHKKMLAELEKRKNSLTAKKANFEKQLNNLRQDREKFSKEKKDELDKLNNEISSVRDDKARKKKQLEEEKINAIKKQDEEHHKLMEELKKKIDESEKQFLELKKKNQTEETKLKGNLAQSQGLLDANIMAYDQTMEEKMKEKSELQDDLDKINKELSHLTEHFSKIEQERHREKELEQLIQRKKQEHEQTKKRRALATQTILDAYRRYKDQSKKKKKKGNKGKKK